MKMVDQKKSIIEIASTIQVHKSTVFREIKRNCDKRSGNYDHNLAHKKCLERHQKKPKFIRLTEDVESVIKTKLQNKLSPEQISNRCKLENIPMVSHEAIYNLIWKDKKKKGLLYKNLRNQGKKRRNRGHLKDNRGIIKNRKSISERPIEVEQKQRIGDLEIDTVVSGKGQKEAIITVNDRKTQKLKIIPISCREAEIVKNEVIKALYEWKFIKTITSDNGKEFAFHEEISKTLSVDFYFADPYKSWQRGANENMNKLIRQYLPKKTDFSKVTPEQIKYIEDELNNRPRKKLNYKTPNEVLLQEILIMEGKVAFMT
jgi:IS30 family transposase